MMHIFVDESGTPVLADQIYYVISSVICRDNEIERCLASLSAIKNTYKVDGELKSSKIGGQSEKRKGILTELSGLNISIMAIAINKSVLNTESGLRFKTSMYKYCQRKLFDKIFKLMDNVTVTCDSYGTPDFMKSFEKYLDKHFPVRLFSEKEFKYSNPENEPMLQISDFIGGSIRRAMQGDDSRDIINCISEKMMHLEEWPIAKKNPKENLSDNDLDQVIAAHSFKKSLDLIDSENEPLLKECYSYLAFDRYGDGEFIFGDAILAHLKEKEMIDQGKDRDWLMQKVIAPLRDKGAIIVSSRDGYKIPESREDIRKFAEFVQEKTDSYLDRYQNIRKTIYYGTETQYDLLDDSPLLKKYIKKIHEID